MRTLRVLGPFPKPTACSRNQLLCLGYHFGMKPRPTENRARAGAPIAAAALATCAFVWLVSLSLTFGGSFSIAAYGSNNASDSSFSHLMTGFVVVGVPALAAWGISVNHRCINITVRRVLLTAVVLMGLWLVGACVASIAFGVTDPPLVVIAVVSDLVLALFIESYIDARILPSMHRYRMMFRRLPFDLRIMNDGGRVIYQTDIARPLDNTTLWQLASRALKTIGPREGGVDEGEAVPYYSESLPDVVFKLYRLDAGVALLTEDASEINQLQQRLEERQAQLVNQNDILRRNHAMQSLLFRQRRERELGERVERDLASTAAQIRRILDNRIVGDSPYARAERIQQLNLVKVLVAYSKRKGMLALAAAEYEALTSAQLELVVREAMADLHSIGIECAVLVESGSTIPIAAFNTIYDSFYDCIISVLPFASPVIMTYITTCGEDTLEMRANIECAIGLTDGSTAEMIPQVATSTDSWTAVQLEIARNLEGRLATRGGDYTVSLDEGLVNVTVRAAAPASARASKTGGASENTGEGGQG